MPDFFETADSLQVIEQHIQSLMQLEEKESVRIIKRYKEVRRDLNDRLLSSKSGSFTQQNLRGVMAQIESAINAMSSSIKDEMLKGAELAAETGVNDLVEEMQVFEDHFTGAVIPINVDAAAIATETSNLLMEQYATSMSAYDAATRARIGSVLSEAVITQMPYSQVVSELGQNFLAEQWKIERIARTELHNIYGKAKLRGMMRLQDGSVPDLKKTLIHPMDHRTAKDSKYVAKLDLIVPIDEPFKYKWAGKWREYMTPPDRPNDRSILVPYREVWSEETAQET